MPFYNVDDNQLEVYVGATGRNFRDKLCEYKDSIAKGNLVTALVQRAYEKDINIDWKDDKVTKSINNHKDLPIREKL